MRKIDPIRIMEKFRKTDVKRWPEMLAEYDHDALCDFVALLMVSNFYVIEQLEDISKVLKISGVIKGI